MQFPLQDLYSLVPILSLLITAFIVVIIEAAIRKSSSISYWISIIGIIVTIILTVDMFNYTSTSFFRMFQSSSYGSYFSILFMISALFTIVLSRDYLINTNAHYGEYYALVIFATIGMIFMATLTDLVVLFLGVELMSLCLYILAGFMRKKIKSNEAALKYFLLGAFMTGFLVYGIALLYGATNTTNIEKILEYYSSSESIPSIFWLGTGFLIIGLTFKIAAVPFHMWVPDVYEGSPTTISAFMSTGAKAAAFAAFISVFSNNILMDSKIQIILGVLATGSMVVGNIIAISQNNIKRMLAYSSIAHAGYMLIGLAAASEDGKAAIMFYLSAYTLMNIGAFGTIAMFEKDEDKNLSFDDYVGLASKYPIHSALMAIFMFSLIGIPPFAGFFGKYYIFVSAIDSGLTWLAIVGVLMSVVSTYYYLRLVVLMYFKESENILSVNIKAINNSVLFISAIGLFLLGIFPSILMQIIENLI